MRGDGYGGEITGIPIWMGDRRVGTGRTELDSLVILWDRDVTESFKDAARSGLVLGMKLEPIMSPANPLLITMPPEQEVKDD